MDGDELWRVRSEWGKKIASVLRTIDVEDAVEMIAAQLRQNNQRLTNGELVVRVIHDLADRIELLPHSMAAGEES